MKNYDLKSNMLKHKAPKKPHTLDYISRLFIHSLGKNPLTSLQACKPEHTNLFKKSKTFFKNYELKYLHCKYVVLRL